MSLTSPALSALDGLVQSVLNSRDMKTRDLVSVFGSMEVIGQQFGISRSAVSQWGEDVPKRRENELRGIHPDIDERIRRARRRLETRAA